MTQSMLMFSLGPVQSFIAQARKTRDLWLGSFLLSSLMEAAMSELERSSNGKDIKDILVFPTKREIEGNIPDLPNKYVAIFNDKDQAIDAAKRSIELIEKRWETICKDVWEEVVEKYKTKETEAIWKRQTNPQTCFEYFWVVVERQVGEQYGKWLKRTQAAFDARKRLRNFALPGYSYTQAENSESMVYESGEKSTISGEREALRGKGISRNDVRAFWRKVARDQSVYDINQEGEERLDALDTIKRFATKSRTFMRNRSDARYPSTSSIATASFVEGLLGNNISVASLKDWLDATDRPEMAQMPPSTIRFLYNLAKKQPGKENVLKRDGDCYFPETFTTYRLEKDYFIIEGAASLADKGRRDLQVLLKVTNQVGITRPTPYYAMIQMDGDHMGTLIGDVEEQYEHTAISEALSNFSRKEAPKITEQEYPGRLIYAGGDDVFALAPLARDIPSKGEQKIGTVLDLVHELQYRYCNKVKAAVKSESHAKVSASVGIAIAHHYTSLSYVRRSSKDAEDLAKNHYGRNALVVTVLRRSGEQTRVGCHWSYEGLEDAVQPIQLFTAFYKLFKNDVLSPKCVYTLLEEAPTLVHLPPKAQQSEINRVLLRQRDKDKEKEHHKEGYVVEQAKSLVELANAMDNAKIDFEIQGNKDTQVIEGLKDRWTTELHSTRWRYGLVEVLGWLLIMAFLARKEQD